MNTENEQLDDLRAELMLYLADELPLARRMALERRLAREPQLNEQLRQLRVDHDAAMNMLHDADRSEPVSASARRIEASIRQWTTRRLADAAQTPARRHRLRWAWPVAAAIAIGYGVWRSIPSAQGPAITQLPRGSAAQVDPQPAIDPVLATAQFDDVRRDGALDEAEGELNALAYMQQSLLQ